MSWNHIARSSSALRREIALLMTTSTVVGAYCLIKYRYCYDTWGCVRGVWRTYHDGSVAYVRNMHAGNFDLYDLG